MIYFGIVSSSRPLPIVTGGTLTSDATYYYRTFTANGTFDVTRVSLLADVLIVAGGGGGSFDGGAGGGAGGYLTPTSQVISGSNAVVIGAGGAGGAYAPPSPWATDPVSGNSTTFLSLTSVGGGKSGGPLASAGDYGAPASGGSGGGFYGVSYRYGTACTVAQAGANGTSGQGYAGGGVGAGTYNMMFNECSTYGGAGGGGAGGVGASANTGAATAGGVGATWLNSVTYAVGGGGATTTGPSGAANSGTGGAGKMGYANTTAGSGGSGIVIVRYTRAQVGG